MFGAYDKIYIIWTKYANNQLYAMYIYNVWDEL